MRTIASILLFLICFAGNANATHNRAGEITLTQIGAFTFEVFIKTFTYSGSAADRSELEVTVQVADREEFFSVEARRVLKKVLPNFYYENHYVDTIIFPGAATYTITVQDPNRNYGVLNIPNSVNVIFSVKTTITINSSIDQNSTPILLNPPIDRAARGHRFIHNPAAYDPDGDSISYELTVCTAENGLPIENYELPQASDTLYIDGATGDLIWDTPVDTGIYNIAIKIKEWRKIGDQYVPIGSINRDMQVDVFTTTNTEPLNQDMRNFCVEAGETVVYEITTTDADNDPVVQFAIGGPLILDVNPATFDTISVGAGYSTSRFTWQTDCRHVRQQPYNVIIKAEDRNDELILIDIDNFHVKVIGPAPKNPIASPSSNSVSLFWDRSVCSNVSGYMIYRRNGQGNYIPDTCQNGVPTGIGYQLVGSTDDRNDSLFIDNNNGQGLSQGIEYCYKITAVYEDGTEGYASEEVCAVLIPGKPAILNVSVTDVDVDGQILLSWARPHGLDTISPGGPYKYKIFRYDDMWANELVEVDSFLTVNLNDTTYLDTLNTRLFPYSYHIELSYLDTSGIFQRYGQKEVASSTSLAIKSGDNQNIISIRKNVPWINDSYIIYRQNHSSGIFDSIAVSYADTFVDQSLTNGVEYCYQVRSSGWRDLYGQRYFNQNLSHIICGTPIDTIPPCPPQLSVIQNCDSLYNELIWTNPNNSCANDVVKYLIYYSARSYQLPELIDSILSPSDTAYIHIPANSLAGCYAVTAVDSFDNMSVLSMISCVSNCVEYELPNVFSPNGDGINDFFRSSQHGFIEKVDMRIFNRWGFLVFQTDDPDINWDGKHMNTNTIVLPGVYYYICDVFTEGLDDTEITNFVGFVYVYTEKNAINPTEK